MGWSLALSVAATVTVVAAPQVRAFVHESERSAVLNLVQLDLRRAAGAASRLGRAVTLCPVAAGGTRCATDRSWSQGWMAFVDANGDGAKGANELRLWLTRNPHAGMGVSAEPAVITFQPYYPVGSLEGRLAEVTVWDHQGDGGARSVAASRAGALQLSEVRFPPGHPRAR